MEVKGDYLFSGTADRVFDALLDPEALKSCIPGCEKFEPVETDVYSVTVKVGIAAVKGTYGGTVRLRDVQRPNQYTLQAEGTGGPGFVKATAVMRLEPQGEKTMLHWTADAQVGGRAASVGSRMLGGVATHIANQFFKCLDGKVQAG
ncbi:MAG: carbon monoxide dehydrogenase [Chloroflexi bacterium]|nr:carbon monoxide dehydrogenase [Chloroflexota bacterium]